MKRKRNLFGNLKSFNKLWTDYKKGKISIEEIAYINRRAKYGCNSLFCQVAKKGFYKDCIMSEG
jgi:hypothetical protein